MKKTKPILYDRVIIHRVKQYLEENVHQTYLDIGVMTRELQNRYPEYSRRKVSPFRLLVEQAYKIVSQSYGLDNVSSENVDSNSDIEVMNEELKTPPNNHMNEMIVNLYSKPKTTSTATGPGSSNLNTNTAHPNLNLHLDTHPNHNSNTNAHKNPVSGEHISIAISSDESVKDGESKSKTDSCSSSSDEGCPHIYDNRKCSIFASNDLSSKLLEKKQAYSGIRSDDNGTKRRDPFDKSGDENQRKKKRRIIHEVFSNKNKKPNETITSNALGSGVVNIPLPSVVVSNLKPRKYKKDVKIKQASCNFSDVGGMESTIQNLCEILMCFKYPTLYHMVGLNPPRGILLHGPPGCGKTLFANCIAGQLGVKIIETAATELIAGISGESEERIRDIFEQAAINAPCVLFIDEIDSISSNRKNAQKEMESRMVSQLIISLDGLQKHENSDGVLVVGATTRPDNIDPSLRRVGRFDYEIPIGIPDRKSRKDILKILCEKLAVKESLDYDKISELTPGYVGADLLALCSRAASVMVRRKCLDLYRLNHATIPIVDLMDDSDVVMTNAENLTVTNVAKRNDDLNEINSIELPIENNGIQNKTDVSPLLDSKTQQVQNTEVPNLNGAKSDLNIQEEKEEEEKAEKKKAEKEKAEEENQNDKNDTVEQKVKDKDECIAEIIEENLPSTSTTKTETKPKTQVTKDPTIMDLMNWMDFSSMKAIQSDFVITLDDFKEATKLIQPSSKREGFITVPDVTWDDIGSLKSIREELQLAILAPVKYPQKLEELGLSAPSGVLLCGPPGCGKTLLAKAIANEAGINFISIKGPELLNMYVGESERAVRTCFQRARNSAPCVIFFDEFDSLCPKRSTSKHESGTRIVNQLLTEMDGVETRKGVYLMAATNRPDIIDPAILRPGRLDKILFVGLPDASDREEILLALTKNKTKPALGTDVDLKEIARLTENFSGADLAGLIRQAAMCALKESLLNNSINQEVLKIKNCHIDEALASSKPSVGLMERKLYEKLRFKYIASTTDLCPMDENLP